MGKKTPTAPTPVDYAAQAQAQGTANSKAALDTSVLGNPNVKTALGGQRVTYTPTGPNGEMQPNVEQYLTPSAQMALEEAAPPDDGEGISTDGPTSPHMTPEPTEAQPHESERP